MALVFANFKNKNLSSLVREKVDDASSLLIRLDEPLTASTLCGKKIYFSGWFAHLNSSVPLSLETENLEIRVDVEELKSESQNVFVGVGICGYSFSSKNELNEYSTIQNLEIRLKTATWKDEESKLFGQQYEVLGLVDLSVFFKNDERNFNTERRFRIRLSVRYENLYAESNDTVIAIVSERFVETPRGGFLFSPASEYYGENLIINGWIAPSRYDECHTVVIKINSRVVSLAKISALEGNERKKLPELSGYFPVHFESVVRREELAKLGFSKSDFAKPLKITAQGLFNSSEQLICEHFYIRWYPSSVETVTDFDGFIETVRETGEGTVQIFGWIKNNQHWNLQFSLEAARTRILFGHGGTLGVKFDIVYSKENRGTINKDKFFLEFDPMLIGKFPGQLKLIVEDKATGKRAEIKGNLRAVQDAVEIARGELSVPERTLRSLMYLASRVGFRRNFSPVTTLEDVSFENQAILDTRPSSVIFATHNLSLCDGATKILLSVIRKFVQKYPETTATVISPVSGPMIKHLNQLKVKTVIVPELTTTSLTYERFRSGMSLAREVFISRKVDFCFANVIDSFWAVNLSFALSINSLWSVHESKSPESCFSDTDPRLRAMFFEAFSEANKLVFVSEASRQQYQRFLEESNSRVIVNGVDIREIDLVKSRISKSSARTRLGIEAGEIVISIMGTACYRKGQDIFLREMALLRKQLKFCDLRFMIVGVEEGEYLNELCQLAEKLEIEDIVDFIPRQPNIFLYYLASDTICICSREEATSLVTLEAFAFEVPLCTTKVCGLSEQVSENVNALCFELSSVGELADNVKRLVMDKGLRQRLIINGRKTLNKKFVLESSLEEYLQAISL